MWRLIILLLKEIDKTILKLSNIQPK